VSWEAISALAEIIGVALIVGSMIYVARQLHQTNTMMRVNAASERLERDYDIVEPVIQDGELAEIWLKGHDDFASPNAADRQRLLFFERRAIMLWHHAYQLRNQSLLPDANWIEQTWVIQNIGRQQAIREAWRIYRGGFELPFQEFLDEQLSFADRNSGVLTNEDGR
jgi:hypothetical protein